MYKVLIFIYVYSHMVQKVKIKSIFKNLKFEYIKVGVPSDQFDEGKHFTLSTSLSKQFCLIP